MLHHSLANPLFLWRWKVVGMLGNISSGQSAGYNPMAWHLPRFPECSTAARWFLQWINISCTIFVCFIQTSLESHQDWLCQLSQLPARKQDERQKLPGHFDVCSTCVCSFCGAIEIWSGNLCFHKPFLSPMWISDFVFHLQCAIYKHNRSEDAQIQDRSDYELFLTHTQNSKQNNFIFHLFQYTWLT